MVFSSSDIRLREKKGKEKANKNHGKKDVKEQNKKSKSQSQKVTKISQKEKLEEAVCLIEEKPKGFTESVDEEFDYKKVEKTGVKPGKMIDYMTFEF